VSQYQPPQPRYPTPGRVPGRGIPDGVLLAGLALLIVGTTVVWIATGLAALLTGNPWPRGVTYGGSALAGRSLITEPGDMTRAWPHTPPGQLPSPTAFWVALGVVLTVLLVGVLLVLRAWLLWRKARATRTSRTAPGSRVASESASSDSLDSLDSKAPKRNQPLPEGE